jgi:hypothetical protein
VIHQAKEEEAAEDIEDLILGTLISIINQL